MEGGEEGGSPGRHGCVSAKMSSWLLQMSCSSAHARQETAPVCTWLRDCPSDLQSGSFSP